MAKKHDAEYCSLEPVFPKEAYILFLFVLHKDQAIGLVPLDGIYETVEEAADATHDVLQQLGETEHITVPEECLLVPITLHSLFPMKRGYWSKPTLSYDQQLRVKAFSNVADCPSLYNLLVTPYLYDEMNDIWHLNATIPLVGDEHTNIIERFMKNSDQIVEPRAKYSAVYSLGDKLQFNWQTKEVKSIDQCDDELLGNIN